MRRGDQSSGYVGAKRLGSAASQKGRVRARHRSFGQTGAGTVLMWVCVNAGGKQRSTRRRRSVQDGAEEAEAEVGGVG